MYLYINFDIFPISKREPMEFRVGDKTEEHEQVFVVNPKGKGRVSVISVDVDTSIRYMESEGKDHGFSLNILYWIPLIG